MKAVSNLQFYTWSALAPRLVQSRGGRVLLHVVTLLRAGHAAWHWQGILRELRRERHAAGPVAGGPSSHG